MYKLFIDDERQPPDDTWYIARNVKQAITLVESLGLPLIISYDHDLGGDETSMQFVRWLADMHYDSGPPAYMVHSANPVGRVNIISYLESWRKSLHGT